MSRPRLPNLVHRGTHEMLKPITLLLNKNTRQESQDTSWERTTSAFESVLTIDTAASPSTKMGRLGDSATIRRSDTSDPWVIIRAYINGGCLIFLNRVITTLVLRHPGRTHSDRIGKAFKGYPPFSFVTPRRVIMIKRFSSLWSRRCVS